MHKHVLGAMAMVMASLIAGPAWTQQAAQDQDNANGPVNGPASQKVRLDQQEQVLRQQMLQLQQQQQTLQYQQQQIDALQSQLGVVKPPPVVVTPANVPLLLSPSDLDALRGTGQPLIAADSQQPVGAPPPPPEKAPEINLLPERGGVLTHQGAFVYEPTIDFAHMTTNTAVISGFSIIPAITVGEIDISKQVLDIYQEVNTFRYGITNHLEIEARVPYVYGMQETTQRPVAPATAVTQFNTVGSSLGDVEAAVHYQVNNGQEGWPYFIGNLRFKTTTGTDPFSIPLNPTSELPSKVATGSGFYAVEPSVTIIYPSDPAVLFANLGYIYNVPATKSLAAIGGTGSASVDERSGPHLSVGLGFGINEASSFSLGFDYESFPAQLIGGLSQPGTALAIGSVLIGYSYRLNDRIAFNLTTAIGTTADAPNTHVILRVPIQFQVFGEK